MRGNVLTSSPVRQKDKLQQVFTVYAAADDEQKTKTQISKRVVMSQLSFHDDDIRQKRLNIIDQMQRPESQQSTSQNSQSSHMKPIEKILKPYILFELNRPINYPVSDWEYYLKIAKDLSATDRKYTDVDFTESYSWDKLIISGNRLLVTDFLLLQIKSLDISDNEIDDIKLELMVGICDQLTTEQKTTLPLFASLKTLDLSMNFFSDFQKLSQFLAFFPNLIQVNLCQIKFRKVDSEQGLLSNITTLLLDSNRITKQFLLSISSSMPNLTFLSLCDCLLSPAQLPFFSQFQNLVVLKIKDNPKIRDLNIMKTFLINLSLPRLQLIDMSVPDSKQNSHREASHFFSKDEYSQIFDGKLHDLQQIEICLYSRLNPLGTRIPYFEKSNPTQSCLLQETSIIDSKNIPNFLNSTKSENVNIRCKSMLQTVFPNNNRPKSNLFATKLVRPLSNRKHFLGEDGLDYFSNWLRQQNTILADNSLISDSIQSILDGMKSQNRSRLELIEEIEHKNEQDHQAEAVEEQQESAFFVTDIDHKDDLKLTELKIDQKVIQQFQKSIFDDSLLSKDLFDRLNLVLGPTSEIELQNHPIDTSGLNSFLPRGVNTNMQELYKALKQTLANPQGDEFQIADEEILRVLMDEVK